MRGFGYPQTLRVSLTGYVLRTTSARDIVPPQDGKRRLVRVAATGDIHCSEKRREKVAALLAGVAEQADLLLVAGDLTTHGEPDQAAIAAEICGSLGLPVFAVLGNHDWHGDRRDDVMAELAHGGICVLEGRSTVVEIAGSRVGIAGAKGFVGGFAGGSLLADFGEPAFRQLHRITSREVDALELGLEEIASCDMRIALLHYSPTAETLVGEPREIWLFLGSERLAAPIRAHSPHLVVHGHAHAGVFQGKVGDVPVYNVSMEAMNQGYAVFELHPTRSAGTLVG